MVGQIMEQVPITQLGQKSSGQRSEQSGASGFDEMLQQKRQASEEPAGTKDRQPVQRKDEPRAETAQGEKPAPGKEEESLDDAKAVLAAMMVQPQPQLQTAAPEAAETAGEAVEAVAAQADVIPEAAQAAVETAVEAVPEAAPETAEVQPRQTVRQDRPAQQAEEVPQAAEQSGQQSGQAETVARAPEAAQTQPRQAREDGEQALKAEVSTERARQQTGEEETPAEAPLFQPETVEQSVPVKVADPAPVLNEEQPLPIESEQAPELLAEVMTTGVENGREVSIIRIDPENLGPVRMTLSRDAEGTLHLALEAADPKTQALLEKHAGNVENIMAGNLREEVRVEVRQNDRSEQQDWTDGQNRQEQQQSRRQREQAREDGTDDFVQRLRLGLVNAEDDDD